MPGQMPPYGYPPYGYAVYQPVAPTNTMAILALVFVFVFSPLAIVFGHIARKQISQTGEQGSGLATGGLIGGYILTGIQVLFCVGYLIFIVAVLNSGNP